MKKIKDKNFFVAIFSTIFLLAACAQSSGVMNLGKDTYNISVHAAPARGGIPGAKKIALSEASAHCQSLGKVIEVQNMSAQPSSHFSGGTADIVFQCLAEKETNRPVYKSAPNVVIENR